MIALWKRRRPRSRRQRTWFRAGEIAARALEPSTRSRSRRFGRAAASPIRRFSPLYHVHARDVVRSRPCLGDVVAAAGGSAIPRAATRARGPRFRDGRSLLDWRWLDLAAGRTERRTCRDRDSGDCGGYRSSFPLSPFLRLGLGQRTAQAARERTSQPPERIAPATALQRNPGPRPRRRGPAAVRIGRPRPSGHHPWAARR